VIACTLALTLSACVETDDPVGDYDTPFPSGNSSASQNESSDETSDDGSSSDERETFDSTQSLIDGRQTLDRPEIGLLRLNGSFCTATLISPKVLITAKHCTAYTTCDSDGCGQQYGGTFYVNDASGNYNPFDVARFRVFNVSGQQLPDGQRNNITSTDRRRSDYYLNDDVAMVLLEDAVPSSLATPTDIVDTEPSAGTDLSVWGYGCTQRGGRSDYKKRYRDFGVGQRSNNLCPGDSGGPVTLDRPGEVAFVNSAYVPSVGIDVFGDVSLFHDDIVAQAQAWGAPLSNTNNNGGSTGGNNGGSTGGNNGGSTGGNNGGSNGGSGGSGTQPSPLVFEASQSFSVPDGSSLGLTLGVQDSFDIGQIDVELQTDHSRPIDLGFTLTSPSGQRIVLQQPGSDRTTSRSFALSDFNGQDAQGQWELRVYDVYYGQTGNITGLRVTFRP
jgi:V8-like Glu-specific endopeptidase